MMMLHNKNAIIYGAGGSMGGAVACAFAAAGARVFLTGRNLAPLQNVADRIRAAGGLAQVAEVDALDETEVKDYTATIVQLAGTLDISFNAIGLEVVQNMPLTDLSAEDFVRPINIAMRTHFFTSTAAANVMMKQRSGTILSLTATPGGIGYPSDMAGKITGVTIDVTSGTTAALNYR